MAGLVSDTDAGWL